MNISNIIYYTRTEGAETSTTLSLRNFHLRDDLDLEALFHAVKDAVDTADLLARFRRLVYESVEFEVEEPGYIRFLIYDLHGNTNYLKFKKGKEEAVRRKLRNSKGGNDGRMREVKNEHKKINIFIARMRISW
jgi:hypothetical protein